MNRVTDVSEGLLNSFYISGLKPAIQRDWMIRKPQNPFDFSNPKPPLAIKWISSAEHQERLSKGLCFNCDNKWVCGHKCLGKFLLLLADDEDDAVQESEKDAVESGKFLLLTTDDEDDTVQESAEDAVESGDISILNSLIGQGSPRSL
ncbi:hypothetical protein Tco_1300079 [Tanacetum coccineum]